MVVYIINVLVHNDVRWEIVRIGEEFFARHDEVNDGPYGSYAEAEEFVLGVSS